MHVLGADREGWQRFIFYLVIEWLLDWQLSALMYGNRQAPGYNNTLDYGSIGCRSSIGWKKRINSTIFCANAYMYSTRIIGITNDFLLATLESHSRNQHVSCVTVICLKGSCLDEPWKSWRPFKGETSLTAFKVQALYYFLKGKVCFCSFFFYGNDKNDNMMALWIKRSDTKEQRCDAWWWRRSTTKLVCHPLLWSDNCHFLSSTWLGTRVVQVAISFRISPTMQQPQSYLQRKNKFKEGHLDTVNYRLFKIPLYLVLV